MKRIIPFALIGLFAISCSSNNEQSILSSCSSLNVYQSYDIKEGHNYCLSSYSYVITPFDENKSMGVSSVVRPIDIQHYENTFLTFNDNSMTINVYETVMITDEWIVTSYGSKEAFEQEITNNPYLSYDNNTITYSGIIECQYDYSIDTFVSTSNKGYYPYCMYSSISSGSFELHFKLKTDNTSITVSLTNYIIQEDSKHYLVSSDPLFYHSLEEIPDEHLHDTESTIVSSRRMETYEFVFSR